MFKSLRKFIFQFSWLGHIYKWENFPLLSLSCFWRCLKNNQVDQTFVTSNWVPTLCPKSLEICRGNTLANLLPETFFQRHCLVVAYLLHTERALGLIPSNTPLKKRKRKERSRLAEGWLSSRKAFLRKEGRKPGGGGSHFYKIPGLGRQRLMDLLS